MLRPYKNPTIRLKRGNGQARHTPRVAGVARYTPTGDWYTMFLIRFRNSALRAALVINFYPRPTGRCPIRRPRKGAQLEPHLLVGWGILAHGETVGHGALRHQRRAPWDTVLTHPHMALRAIKRWSRGVA